MSSQETKVPSQEESLEHAIQRCKEKNVFIPTFKMLRDPSLIPAKVKSELKNIDLWAVNPLNLFRITWKNEPVKSGGTYDKINYIEIPSALSGVKAKIYMLVGKYFPTGAHKVGASFGPIVEKLVTGKFDPTIQKALWPSTGNYCRGGAFNSALLGCQALAVLPAEMSPERFKWLKDIGSEVYATPGCESNVKEVFDKNNQLVKDGKGLVVSLNQFAEFSNPLWHYYVTGDALKSVFEQNKKAGDRCSGVCLTQGSAGTIAGVTKYLREQFPLIKVVAGEADQCPTILENGFGGHRIEGIGDKHIPWIFDIKNLDMVVDINDENCIEIMHLFGSQAGQKILKSQMGLSDDIISKLSLMGISSIANMLGCIKMAKYYEYDEHDIVLSLCTDSMEMYQSRLQERKSPMTETEALIAMKLHLHGVSTDRMLELGYYEKKRIHNLKYFTWIEQQGKTIEELNAQWFNHDEYWDERISNKKIEELDTLITEFNKKTGLAQKYA